MPRPRRTGGDGRDAAGQRSAPREARGFAWPFGGRKTLDNAPVSDSTRARGTTDGMGASPLDPSADRRPCFAVWAVSFSALAVIFYGLSPRWLYPVRGVWRCSRRTEAAYVRGIVRLLHFHRRRYLLDMSVTEKHASQTHRAVDGQVSASTQDQASSAWQFFDPNVLEVDPRQIVGVVPGGRLKRPTGMSRCERLTWFTR